MGRRALPDSVTMQPAPAIPRSKVAAHPSAVEIGSGDLEARFVPAFGMLGVSLRHCGAEVLRRVDDLDAAAVKGSTAGFPLLHPWANRLAGPSYRAAGKTVALDPTSPLLHLDANGLPMHGVPWARLTWEVMAVTARSIEARLDWTGELLSVFPFPHRLELAIEVRERTMRFATRLAAGPEGPVPVSFGFHPYFGLPGAPTSDWRARLPAMTQLVLDERGIPTGEERAFPGMDEPLESLALDAGFAVLDEGATFSLAGDGRRVTLQLLTGYRYAQVFAPPGGGVIAFEPMTAPTAALSSGSGLRIIQPGGEFRAVFEVHFD
jgi:aldose 1-epimerase